MKKLFTTLLLSAALTAPAHSAIKIGEGDYTATIGGYVRTEMFFDTRENFEAREGHLMILPKMERLDLDNKDLNERFKTNLLSIQTRLNLKVTGPEVWGAKTSGYIEAEFFGTSDADVNGVRMRHAYIDMNWKSTSIRAGQTWHPLFDGEIFAGTISFNTGVPFQPFARAPQLRVTQNFTPELSLFGAISSNRDFSAFGPSGLSNNYLRNSGIPELSAGLKYKTDAFTIGVNGEFKKQTPRTEYTVAATPTAKTYRTEASVSSFAANTFIKFKSGDLLIKAMGMYGQNMNDMLMIAGYTVKAINANGDYEYTPFNMMSAWGDIAYGKDIEVGIFFGYTKNLGTADSTIGNLGTTEKPITPYYSRYATGNKDVESAFRVSPRVIFTTGAFKIGAELEYTSATYGTMDNLDKNSFKDTKAVNNIRGLITFMLNI